MLKTCAVPVAVLNVRPMAKIKKRRAAQTVHTAPAAFMQFLADHGNSFEAAAKALGTSYGMVYQIARGIRPVPALHAPRWAITMGIGLDALRPDMVAPAAAVAR